MCMLTLMKAHCSEKINFSITPSTLCPMVKTRLLIKECRRSGGAGEEKNKRHTDVGELHWGGEMEMTGNL